MLACLPRHIASSHALLLRSLRFMYAMPYALLPYRPTLQRYSSWHVDANVAAVYYSRASRTHCRQQTLAVDRQIRTKLTETSSLFFAIYLHLD